MKRLRLPSLTSLKNFEAVARHLNFTKAGHELCVTQGAVSHQVKLLEEDLQTPLLIRGRAGIELTHNGIKLLAVLSDAFDDLGGVIQEIRDDVSANRKRLKIHVTPQFCHYWFAPRITQFSAENPDIEVYVSAAPPSSVPHIDEYALQIVSAGTQLEGTPFADKLFSSNLVPLCNPRLLDACRPSEVLSRNTLLCETSHDWWPEWHAVAGSQSQPSDRRLHFDDPVAMVRVAASGTGALMGSATLLREYISSEQLIAPYDPDLFVSRAYYLVCGNEVASSDPAKAFRAWLLDEIKVTAAV